MYKKYVKSGNIKRPYYYASIRVKGKVRNFYLGRDKSVAQKKEKQLLTKQQSKQSKIIHKLKTLKTKLKHNRINKTKINYNKFYPFILIGLIVFGMSFFYIFKEPGITGITGLTVWETLIQSDFDEGTYNQTEWDTTDSFVGLSTNDTYQELPNNQEDGLAMGLGWINMTDNVLLLHLNDDPSYDENGTHVYDFSGNDNNGTFYNNVTTEVGTDTGVSGANETGQLNGTGVGNASYSLDGDGDYVAIPDSVALSPPADMTIALWIYAIDPRRQVLVCKDVAGAQSWDFLLMNDQQLRLNVYQPATGTADSTNTVPLNTWIHVAVVYNYVADTTSGITFYINGTDAGGSVSTSRGPIQDTTTDITIGWRDVAAYNDFFNGTIDEVAIWNRSLSAQEIRDIYDIQKGDYTEKGHYLSEVFDSGNRGERWNNISWAGEITYGEMPSDQKDEINDLGIGINMTGNILLLHLNNDSAYGENDTYVYDFSGNDNNGTAFGTTQFNSTHYRVGTGSFGFNGSSTYINISNPNIAGLNTTGTIAAWAYPQFGIDGDRHVIVDTRGSDTNYGFMIAKGDAATWSDGFACGWRSTSGVADWDTSSYAWDQERDKWHHFAMAWDANTLTKTCYIDGTILYNDTAANFPTDVSDKIQIGADSTIDLNPGWSFDGLIDEVAIWNRTLSTAEVQDLYKRGALRLNVSVRSCDDSACDGESWSNTYTSTPQNLAVPANRYFQYRAEFEAYDTSLTPQLYNVTVDHEENLFVIDDDWGNCCCVDNETSFVNAIVNVTGCDFHVNGTLYLTNVLFRIDEGGTANTYDFNVDAGGLLYANESTVFEEDGQDVALINMYINDNATFEHNSTFEDEIAVYLQGDSNNVLDSIYADGTLTMRFKGNSVNYINHSNFTSIDYFEMYGNSNNTFDNVSFLGTSTLFSFYENSKNEFYNVSFHQAISTSFYDTSNNTFIDCWGDLSGRTSVKYFYLQEDSTNYIENCTFDFDRFYAGGQVGVGEEYPNITFVNFTFTGRTFYLQESSHTELVDSSINSTSWSIVQQDVGSSLVEVNNFISNEKMDNEYAVNSTNNGLSINLTRTNFNNLYVGEASSTGTLVVRDSQVAYMNLAAGDTEWYNITNTGALSAAGTSNNTMENSTIGGAVALSVDSYNIFKNVNFSGTFSVVDNANSTFEGCFFEDDGSGTDNLFYEDSNTTFISCNATEEFWFYDDAVALIMDSEFYNYAGRNTRFLGRTNITVMNTNFTGAAANDRLYIYDTPNVTFEQPYSTIYELLIGNGAELATISGYFEVDHYCTGYGPGIYLGATFNRFFPFNLTYSGGDPAEGINVSISENSTNPFTSGLTDSKGFVNLNLTFDASMVDTEFEIFVDGVKKRNLTWINSTAPYGIEFDMPPRIEFVSPSWDNGTATGNNSIDVNISMPHAGDLDNFTWNWNGTNYTFYDDSLVLMLNFDNVSALGENDTLAKDLSGYGNDGIGSSFDIDEIVTGKYGNAIDLDGVDDYVNCGGPVTTATNDITMEVWVKWEGTTGDYQMIVLNGNDVSSGYDILLMKDEGDNIEVRCGGGEYADTDTVLTVGQWQHIVAVRDSGTWKVYLDGTALSVTGNPTPLTPTTGTYIGGDQAGAFNFNGTIDEVRILNRSLTAEEINQSYMSNLRKYDTNNWEFYTNQTNTPSGGLVEGDYTYYANARDDSGNENMTEERTIIVDFTAPVVDLDAPVDFANFSTALDFNYTASDALVTLDTCELWGNWTTGWHLNETFISPTESVANGSSVITIEEGVYVWSVYCNDTFGNSNTTVHNYSLTVDTSGPVVSLDNPADFYNEIASGAVVFNYTADDTYSDVDTCELWGNWTSSGWHLNETFISPPKDATNGSSNVTIEDGLYVWSVYCNDTFGNSNTTVENRTLKVDTAGPVVDLDNPADFFNETATGSVVFNYTADDTYSDVDTCELWGNWSGGWHLNESFVSPAEYETNGSSNITLLNGTYLWSVYCNDTLGNSNTTVHNYSLVVDTAWPVVNLNDPVDFLNISTALDFNYTASDVPSGLDTCQLWGNWTSSGWHLNETFISPTENSANGSSVLTIEDGNYLWNVWCNDTLGISGFNDTNYTITIDATTPIVNIDYPVNGSTIPASNLNKDFNFSITENNLDSCWYELNSSGVNVTIADCSGGNRSVVVSLVKALWNNISIWVNDSANNEGTNITYVFTNTAPPIPSLSLPLNNSQHLYSNLTFEWGAVTDEDGDSVVYDINFTNSSFEEEGFVSGLSSNTHTNSTLPDGWTYWTVRSYDGNDYSAWNSSNFYVDNVAAKILISPHPSVTKNPGQSQAFTITQSDGADWTTNISIRIHDGSVDTGVVDASNNSDDLDGTWSYTYPISSTQSSGILVVDVYGWNNTLAENITNTTQLIISKPLGPAVGVPRITNFYPNVTYANGSETIGITLDLDLDVLNQTVTVTVTNSSTVDTVLTPDNIVSDDTLFDYTYNYSFIPTVENQTYLFEATVTDTNLQSNTSNFTVFVKAPVSINLTTVGGTDIKVKDINSGIVLTSGTAIAESFTEGEYNLEVSTAVGTVTLYNATVNTSDAMVLDYVDKDESASIPSNNLAVDRFLMASDQSFSNNAQIVYDYSLVNASIITDSNLKMYKCASEASCDWGDPIEGTSVDISASTLTATLSSFSIFLVVEDIATLTATSPAAAQGTGGGASLQKASVKIVTPAALTANPLKMLLEDRVSIPIQIKNNGNKPLNDITLTAVSENPLISLELDKTFIRSLAVGASEIVMATVTSILTEPGVYTAKLTSSAASPAVSDDSELIIAVVSVLEEKVEQIITRVVFAKDLFKEHPECLELQELLDRADKAIEIGEYEKARTLTETAILGCQDMITALTLKREVPGRLPFTKQQIIILIVVISSALALLLYLITSKGFGRRTVIKREKTREKRKTFKLPTFKFKKKAEKKKADIWKRR